MLNFLLTWLVSAASLMITAHLVPGFELASWTDAAIAAIILGLVNAVVRPILVFLTLPLTILTLGLFLLVINALMLWLVSSLTPGFVVTTFFSALIGSIVLTLVSTVLGLLVNNAR